MKKIFLLLAVVAGTTFTSCEGPEGPQGPAGYTVEAETFEIRNVNFINDGTGFYGILYDLDPVILNSDSILLYRLKSSNGTDVWEPLPTTYYFDDGVTEQELDYNFDFTTNDISIYLGYTDQSVLQPAFTQNQVFRVVVIPGYLSNKIGNKDYNSVTKELKISEEDFTKSARN
jgi:hypothetical protein